MHQSPPPVMLDLAGAAVNYWSFFASQWGSLQKRITNDVEVFLTADQNVKTWHNSMLLNHSGLLACTQTTNLRLANSPGLFTGIKEAEVQTQRSEKQVRAYGDTAH